MVKPTFLTIPLSWIYTRLVSARQWFLKRRAATRLPVPVISVGNITVGGTGKTEMVALICRWLTDRGLKPAVLSRGYRRQSKDATLVVSDGRAGPLVDVRSAGDEPYVLARRLPSVPVIVGKDRIVSGRLAIERFGCNVLVLDDGFQRRHHLARDLDILLLDAADPFGGERLLPAGYLREPLNALDEADLVVLTRADQYATPSLYAKLAERFRDKPVLTARHAPQDIVLLHNRTTQPLTYLTDRRVIAVSGIGRPESFIQTLKKCGAEVVQTFAYPDHHWYTAADCREIRQQADRLDADIVMTTKDAVRFTESDREKMPGWVLQIKMDILTPKEGLEPYLKNIVDKAEAIRPPNAVADHAE